MTFYDCLMTVAADREFVENYDRLRGTQISAMSRRSGFEAAIDQATGYEVAQLRQFVADVWDLVWCRIPR